MAKSYPHWFEGKEIARASENVRIILPDNLAQRILHWGYREQGFLYEDTIKSRGLIQKRLRGEELSPADNDLLISLHEKYQTKAKIISDHFFFWNRILQELAWGTTSHRFGEKPLVRARHDVGTIVRSFAAFSLQLRELENWVSFYRKHPKEWIIRDSAGGTLGDLLTAQAALGAGERINLQVGDTYPYLLEQYTLVNNIDWVIAISNILLNLFSNTDRYLDSEKPEGAIAAFSSSLLPKGSVEIRIRDNGIGIKKENLKKLGGDGFCEGRKAVEGSQGIGLSSVIATLNSLGVPFWVRSEEGVGSEFRFLLPGWLLMKNGEIVAAREDFATDLAHVLELNAREEFVIPIASRFSGN